MRVNEKSERWLNIQGILKIIFCQNHWGESSPSLYFCLTFQLQNWGVKSLDNEKQGFKGLAACKSKTPTWDLNDQQNFSRSEHSLKNKVFP